MTGVREPPASMSRPQWIWVAVISFACGRSYEGEPLATVTGPLRPRSILSLPSDQMVGEPLPPLVGSDHEKAVVYLHRHGRSCVGVIVAPRVIATAHQCVDSEASGVALPDAT